MPYLHCPACQCILACHVAHIIQSGASRAQGRWDEGLVVFQVSRGVEITFPTARTGHMSNPFLAAQNDPTSMCISMCHLRSTLRV